MKMWKRKMKMKKKEKKPYSKFPKFMPVAFIKERKKRLENREENKRKYKIISAEKQRMEEKLMVMEKKLYGGYKIKYKKLYYEYEISKINDDKKQITDIKLLSEMLYNKNKEMYIKRLTDYKEDKHKWTEKIKNLHTFEKIITEELTQRMNSLWNNIRLLDKKQQRKKIMDQMLIVFNFWEYGNMVFSVYEEAIKCENPVDYLVRSYFIMQDSIVNTMEYQLVDILKLYIKERDEYRKILEGYKKEYTKYVYDFYLMTKPDLKKVDVSNHYKYFFYVLTKVFGYDGTEKMSITIIAYFMRMKDINFKPDKNNLFFKNKNSLLYKNIDLYYTDIYTHDKFDNKIKTTLDGMVNIVEKCLKEKVEEEEEEGEIDEEEGEIDEEEGEEEKEGKIEKEKGLDILLSEIIEIYRKEKKGLNFLDKYTKGININNIEKLKNIFKHFLQVYDDCMKKKYDEKLEELKNMKKFFNILKKSLTKGLQDKDIKEFLKKKKEKVETAIFEDITKEYDAEEEKIKLMKKLMKKKWDKHLEIGYFILEYIDIYVFNKNGTVKKNPKDIPMKYLVNKHALKKKKIEEVNIDIVEKNMNTEKLLAPQKDKVIKQVEKKEEIIHIENGKNLKKEKLKGDQLSKQIESMINDYDGENKKSFSTASNEKQFKTMADFMNTEIENDSDDE
jgi:hypothetical protein